MRDCIGFVGRFVNQYVEDTATLLNRKFTCYSDDNVEEGHIASSFEITYRAWKVGHHFSAQTGVLMFATATVRRSLHILWLSVAGQFLLRFTRAVLMAMSRGIQSA